MFLYHSTKREPTCKCMRCGLKYKESEYTCPHCAGKTNAEIIRDIHIPHSKQLEKTSSIGRQFFYIAIIITCVLLVLFK